MHTLPQKWTTNTNSKSKNSVKNGSSKEQATATIAIDLDGITGNYPKLAKAAHDLFATNTMSLQAQVSRLTNKLDQLHETKNQSPGTNQSSVHQPRNNKSLRGLH
jgi:hypothetical protein